MSGNKESGANTNNFLAITDSDGNERQPLASQPRPPRNFKDLIRYSAEVTDLGGSEERNYNPLDQERRKFLEEAFKSMTVDIIQELKAAIQVLESLEQLKTPDNFDPAKYEEALDQICEYIDQIDVANDFHKIGGFHVVKLSLAAPFESVRWRGAEVVAQLCQNNPYCQNKIVEVGFMPTLLKMIESDVDPTVRVKAFYAVSCITRQYEEGLKEFIQKDGLSVLLKALQANVEKLVIKASFLLSSLCHSSPNIKDELVKMGYIEQLVIIVANYVYPFVDKHPQPLEHLLNAIASIVQDHPPSQEIARKSELRFKILLERILKHTTNCDQYIEENNYVTTLITIIFNEVEE